VNPGRHIHALFALVALIAAATSCNWAGSVKRIGILNWSEDLVGYGQAYKGIIDGLHANGYQEGFNIHIDYQNAQGNDAEAKKLLKRFVQSKYDLIVTIGSPASLAALDAVKEREIPVVFTVVGNPKETGIINDWSAPGKNVTGVSIDIPLEIYYSKLRSIMPNAKKLGIIYVNKYATAKAASRSAAAIAPQFGFEPHMIAMDEGNLDRLEDVVGPLRRKIDVVFFTADPVLYSETMMKKFIPAFKKIGVPAMILSDNYLKYGALLAINSSFYNMGRQTVPHIVKVMNGIAAKDIPSEQPYDYIFTVNKGAAKELGIDLGWNVLVDADSIVE